MISVHLLSAANLYWGENDRQLVQNPQYKVGGGTYPRQIDVDPAPCYAHDMSRVSELAARCWDAFPLAEVNANLYLLSHEYTARNNGIAFEDWVYYQADGSKYPQVKIIDGNGGTREYAGKQALTICLAGKRIPPMPSMTRYLVAHEYGHLAWYRAGHLSGWGNLPTDFYKKYMEMRGCPEVMGKRDVQSRWHQLPSEIVANDFRILMLSTEAEFWPHEVPHPHDLGASVRDAVLTWWRSMADLARTGDFDPKIIPAPAEQPSGA